MTSDVIHSLLQIPSSCDVLHQLFKGHRVKYFVRCPGELVIDQTDRDFAGREFAHRRGFAGTEPALQPADDVAHADVAGAFRQSVSAAAADLAFQKPAATKRQKD